MDEIELEAWAQRSGERLRAALPAPTVAELAHLRAARSAAVAAIPAAPPTTMLPFAVAAVLVLTVGMGLSALRTSTPPVPSAQLATLLDEEELQLLDELEFYAWLELQAEDPPSGTDAGADG